MSNRADYHLPPTGDFPNRHPVQAQGIGSIGRPGREDSSQEPGLIIAGMRFQDAALSLMQPGNHDQFIAHLDPLRPLCHRHIHFEPGVGRAFAALVRGCSTILERRAEEGHLPNRLSNVRGNRYVAW